MNLYEFISDIRLRGETVRCGTCREASQLTQFDKT